MDIYWLSLDVRQDVRPAGLQGAEFTLIGANTDLGARLT